MLETLVSQYFWIVVIVALVVIWMIFKLVRKTIGKVVGLIFAVAGIIRLWTMFNL